MLQRYIYPEFGWGHFTLLAIAGTVSSPILIALLRTDYRVRGHGIHLIQFSAAYDNMLGVIVFLRQPETPRDMVQQIEAMIQGHGDEDQGDDQRTYGIGAQILADLGVRKMSLLSAPKVFHGLAGFGLEVVDYYSDQE